MTDKYIGLERQQAEQLLRDEGVEFSVVVYSDRKQAKFDKEIVTATREQNGVLQLIVCRYLFVAQ